MCSAAKKALTAIHVPQEDRHLYRPLEMNFRSRACHRTAAVDSYAVDVLLPSLLAAFRSLPLDMSVVSAQDLLHRGHVVRRVPTIFFHSSLFAIFSVYFLLDCWIILPFTVFYF